MCNVYVVCFAYMFSTPEKLFPLLIGSIFLYILKDFCSLYYVKIFMNLSPPIRKLRVLATFSTESHTERRVDRTIQVNIVNLIIEYKKSCKNRDFANKKFLRQKITCCSLYGAISVQIWNGRGVNDANYHHFSCVSVLRPQNALETQLYAISVRLETNVINSQRKAV